MEEEKPLTRDQIEALLHSENWLLLRDGELCPGCAETLHDDLLDATLAYACVENHDAWVVVGFLNADTPGLLCCNCDLAENITGNVEL